MIVFNDFNGLIMPSTFYFRQYLKVSFIFKSEVTCSKDGNLKLINCIELIEITKANQQKKKKQNKTKQNKTKNKAKSKQYQIY